MTQAQHVYIDGLRYHVYGDKRLPGVTTILGETKDKTFLNIWRQRVGEEAANKAMQDGCDRGNFVHNLIESYFGDKAGVKLARIHINPQYAKLANEALDYVANIQEVLQMERGMRSVAGFAGSPDMVAKIKGKTVLLDWKTSYRRKTKSQMYDYCRQLAAYRHMVEENFPNIKIDQAQIVLFFAGKDGVGGTNVIKLSPKDLDKYYAEFELRLDMFAEQRELIRQARIEHEDMFNGLAF